MGDSGSWIPALSISSSGLDAEARRMEIISENIANANTTAGPNGKVFRRKTVVFATRLADAMGTEGQRRAGAGVEIAGIEEDSRPPKLVYRPGHPDADKDGYVRMSNVNTVEEMVDMMSATRAYEANLAAIRAAKTIATQALGISK